MQLRASALNQCVYCLAMHRRDAKKDGWTDYKEQFSDEECAALELTDAVTRIHGEESVPDELRNRIGITTRLHPRSISGVGDFDLGIRV